MKLYAVRLKETDTWSVVSCCCLHTPPDDRPIYYLKGTCNSHYWEIMAESDTDAREKAERWGLQNE